MVASITLHLFLGYYYAYCIAALFNSICLLIDNASYYCRCYAMSTQKAFQPILINPAVYTLHTLSLLYAHSYSVCIWALSISKVQVTYSQNLMTVLTVFLD